MLSDFRPCRIRLTGYGAGKGFRQQDGAGQEHRHPNEEEGDVYGRVRYDSAQS